MLKVFKIPSVIILLIFAAALVLISWYRIYVAGTVMVDGHGLSGWPAMFVFFSVLLSLGFFSWAYYGLWAGNELDAKQIRFLALVLALVFSFMLPMLSNDIFSYMVFGDASNRGGDVYTNAHCTGVSTFYPYITGTWTSSTCAYGPIILLLAKLATYVGADKIMLAIAVYKMLVLLFAFVFIEIAYRVCGLMHSSVRWFIFVVINPVFLVQGVGQLHADLIAITFIICAVYFLLINKWPLVFIMVALSIATKMNYVLMVPFFVVALALQQTMPWVARFRKIGLGMVLILLVLVAAYFPFYTSSATITTPFTFHFFQSPSKCIGEVLGDIIYFAPQIIGGHNQQLQNTINTSTGPYSQLVISEIIVKICQVFALLGSLYILVRFARGERSLKQWFRVYVRALLLFLLFYLHIFNPWYLMMFWPFMWVDEEPAFIHWLFILTCFISVQDVVCTISRNSMVYPIELVLTFISVMLYLYKPKRMFFTSLGD